MRFRLFGMDVHIQIGFWIGTFLIGSGFGQGAQLNPRQIAIWMVIVLVSIMIHELGHAFMIMRHKIEPSITLHWMGGATSWQAVLPLSRVDMVLISLAGPFAGFAFAGVIYATGHFAPGLFHSELGRSTYQNLMFVNVWWGVVNLIPVLPFDGGHVLEHALGPKRIRATSIISLTIGALVTAVSLYFREIWPAFIFGMGAMRSYQRLSGAAQPVRISGDAPRPAPAPSEAPLPPGVAIPLRRAREALAEEQLGRAMSLANQVLAGEAGEPGEEPTPPPPRGIHGALEILAWVHLLSGKLDDATEALDGARKIAPPDAALVAAILLAKGMKKEARRVLEAARSAGDERKETVGPLIQLLIEQGEVARAAAVAFDIVDSLSEDDARQMARIAFENGAFDWAARLSEAMFVRTKAGDDAYEAARALAKDQQNDRAIELLRKAVDAGFTDRARAWSDAALEALRADQNLEAVLPRP